MSEDLYVPPTPKKDNRQLAMGLAIAAALCMLYGGFTKQWLVNGSKHLEYGFGLRSNFACVTGYDDKQQCESHTNSEVVDKYKEIDPKMASGAFVPTGWITFISILLAAAGLLAAGAMAAAKKVMDLPIAPTTIGLLFSMIALITGCVFVATKPGPPGMVGVGLSFWIFGVGSVMGILGAQMLAKVNRPPDPEWTVD
ncbi:MAG: hypothetical protein HOV81_01445 [Kofleriaceae bacterium]|nr:hypothetical protein [Kofleriaceae bacterium]